MYLKVITLSALIFLTACQGFIFRMDIPQGNYLTKKEVDKLRINMTKEQVNYVLGTSLLPDSFDNDKWYYVYKMKRGMTDTSFTKKLVLTFVDDRLAETDGDFELSEDYNTPLTE